MSKVNPYARCVVCKGRFLKLVLKSKKKGTYYFLGTVQKYCLTHRPVNTIGKRYSGRDLTRHLVRQRDGFACQQKGCTVVKRPEDVKTGKKSLDVHHLKGKCGKKSRGYDKIKDLKMLITLCHYHHYHRHDFSKKGKASMRSHEKVPALMGA